MASPLPESAFAIISLALPRGQAFGDCPPVEGVITDDGSACAVVTRDVKSGRYGFLVMRRREDRVWTMTLQQSGLNDIGEARHLIKPALKEGQPPEKVPPGVRKRRFIADFQGREANAFVKLLGSPTNHIAAKLIQELYLSMPNPDESWVGEFQTNNPHTRLWELLLLACFREQGRLVTQPHPSPDFCIEDRAGHQAWVEAVTANPAVRFEHVGAIPALPPADLLEQFFGKAAEQFSKTLSNKLTVGYTALPHVAGKPFALALADFHSPSSMIWSRQALIGYLYGTYPETVEIGGQAVAVSKSLDRLLHSEYPTGLFHDARHPELSAVIFSNACTLSKFNRVGASLGMPTQALRYVRRGRMYDRTPGVLTGIPFCLDVTSEEYRSLWPEKSEP